MVLVNTVNKKGFIMGLQEYKPGQELSSVDFQAMIGGPLSAVVDAQAQAALSSVNFIKSVGFTPDTEDTEGKLVAGSPVYVTFKYPKVIAPYQAGTRGAVTTINVEDAGSGYDDGQAPVTISGEGSGASALATIESGVVTSITVTSGGSGYDSATTTVSITGGSDFKGNVTTKDVDAVPAEIEQMELEVPILTMLPIPFIRVDEAEIDFHAKITSMSYANVASNFSTSSGSIRKTTKTGSSSGGAKLNLGIFKIGGGSGSKYTNSSVLRTNLSYRSNSRAGNKIDKVFQLGVKVKVSQAEMPEGMEKLMGILEDSIIAKPTDI